MTETSVKTAELSRDQFQNWWEKHNETAPRCSWDALYIESADYYCDEYIDDQYEAWKASRESLGDTVSVPNELMGE